MKQIFDLLSQPMMAALPAGSKLLATGVTTPFMVPLKVTLFAALLIALPYVLWQAWAFVAPGLYKHEKQARRAADRVERRDVLCSAWRTATSSCSASSSSSSPASRPISVNVSPDIEAYFGFVMGMFLAFGLAFEVPIVVVLLVRFGIAEDREAEAGATVCHRRRVHRRGRVHAAGRAVAAAARDPAVRAVRTGHLPSPLRRQAKGSRRGRCVGSAVTAVRGRSDACELPDFWLLCLVWALSLPAPAAPLQVVPDKDVRSCPGLRRLRAGRARARALQLFRQAAERNQRVAQFNLAVMLLGGRGRTA